MSILIYNQSPRAVAEGEFSFALVLWDRYPIGLGGSLAPDNQREGEEPVDPSLTQLGRERGKGAKDTAPNWLLGR